AERREHTRARGVTVAAEPNRDHVGHVLEERPPADRAHEAPVVEAAGVAASVVVARGDAVEERVRPVEDERRVAADKRTCNPRRDQERERAEGDDNCNRSQANSHVTIASTTRSAARPSTSP